VRSLFLREGIQEGESFGGNGELLIEPWSPNLAMDEEVKA
jgi:hypothetical protein